jgi:guanine deaminase
MLRSGMARAIELSVENGCSGHGEPCGAMIVEEGKIVAEQANPLALPSDPTAHAEVIARLYFSNTGAQIGWDNSLIYREITQPPVQRKIPMIAMMRAEALVGFGAWQEKSDEVCY